MEIAYDIDPEDLIDYNMHIFMQPARRRERLLKSLSFSAAMAVPGLILLDSRLPGLGCIIFAMAASIPISTVFLVPRNVRRQLSRLYPRNENSALYGWRRMTIDAERILQVGELMVTGWRWLAVERIEVTDRLVLFFIAQSAALMIPRRAFAEEAALRQFVEAAERFRRAARRQG